MCGIAGIYLRDPAALGWEDVNATCTRLAQQLLTGIEPRGRHATGMLAIGVEPDDTPYLQLQKAACSATEFMREARGVPDGTLRHLLLHTRFATQGHQGWPENNHPVYSGGVYVVHNGHISNDDDLFAATGAARLGRVDSEALPMMIAAQEDWSVASMRAAMEKIEGGWAIAAVRPGEDTMFLVRGLSSPLEVAVYRDLVMFASTKEAIKRAHDKCFEGDFDPTALTYVNEGSLIALTPDGVERHTFSPTRPKYTPGHYYAAGGWKSDRTPTTTTGYAGVAEQYLQKNGYRTGAPHHEWTAEDWDAFHHYISEEDKGKQFWAEKIKLNTDSVSCSSWIVGGRPGYGLRTWSFWLSTVPVKGESRVRTLPADKVTDKAIREGAQRHKTRMASMGRMIATNVKADAAAKDAARTTRTRSSGPEVRIEGLSKKGMKLLRRTLGTVTADELNDCPQATYNFICATLSARDLAAFLDWDGWDYTDDDDGFDDDPTTCGVATTVANDRAQMAKIEDDGFEATTGAPSWEVCDACLETIDFRAGDVSYSWEGNATICSTCKQVIDGEANANVIPLRERLHI